MRPTRGRKTRGATEGSGPMHWWSEQIVNRGVAWTVIGAVALLGGLALWSTRELQHTDDILAFLPQDNAEVELFNGLNREFGTTEVALVGIEVDNPFDPVFLRTLQRLTRNLADAGMLNHVASLTNQIDFVPDPVRGGIVNSTLVDALPESAAEEAALRAKVMSRDFVVGNFIAADARAVLIYCYPAFGTDPRQVAQRIQALVREQLPEHTIYWGGGPFVSTYIYDVTREDLRRLTPWAVLAIVLLMMLAFRDLVGCGLVLVSTAIGTAMAIGLMAAVDVPFNIVLSAMPVVLFATATAYGVHLLARYYEHTASLPPDRALRLALNETGPVILVSGLTTAASLGSFLAMDIAPIRTFGLFTAIGILASMALALTFVPAVIVLARLRPRRAGAERRARLFGRVTAWATTHRATALGLLALAVLPPALAISRVDTSVDYASFFGRGSPPQRAESFLRDRFNGSQFLQILVTGNLTDPHVLREVRRVADRLRLLPEVANVIHLGDAVARSNEAMTGQARIPDTAAQVAALLALIDDPSLEQLVNREQSRGLILVRLRVDRAAEVERALTRIEELLAREALRDFRVAYAGDPAAAQALRELVAARLLALAAELGADAPSDPAVVARTLALDPGPLDATAVADAVTRFLRSEENPIPLPDRATEEATAAALAACGTGEGCALEPTLRGVLGARLPADETSDLALALETPLADAWARARARARQARLLRSDWRWPVGERGERFLAGVETALLDLDNPTAAVGAPPGQASGALRLQPSGVPVMHRGLSRSVTHNQVLSLAVALTLVVVLLSIAFRSLLAGLLASSPTVLTLLLVYGGMGLLGVRLDIGTSMLASIVLGAGVDYAVHLVAAWRAGPTETAAGAAANAGARVGLPITLNAVMIAAGFAVLTLGEAKPLQNVGGLTAASLLIAALMTFVAVPALARRRAYDGLAALAPAPAASTAAVEQATERAPGRE